MVKSVSKPKLFNISLAEQEAVYDVLPLFDTVFNSPLDEEKPGFPLRKSYSLFLILFFFCFRYCFSSSIEIGCL